MSGSGGEMKDEAAHGTTSTWKKEGPDGSSGGGGGLLMLLGKGKGKGGGGYKFWALTVILLLAFWSMFTGTLTLKSSAGHLNPLVHHFDSPIHHDLDVLELEEREKLVRHMWDVYTHISTTIRLPRFWLEAFEAAYEDLASDVPGVRSAAVSEIAKMSLSSLTVQPPPVQSTSTRDGRNISKQRVEKDKKMVTTVGTSK